MHLRRGSRIPFDEVDPFSGNRVRGVLLRKRKRRGDLEITHVNGVACAQYVRATPKIANLEDGEAPLFEHARAYDKIDGTNVLLFHYRDAAGARYASYKTRLSPFLCLQPYADFVALWKEIRARYRGELEHLESSEYSFSFELYGSRLPILTRYETELDARLLHAIDEDSGHIIELGQSGDWSFPMPVILAEASARGGRTEAVAGMEEKLRASFDRRQEDREPVEGAVIYFCRGERAIPRKLKPKRVMERQARYRELYAQGKKLMRARRGADID